MSTNKPTEDDLIRLLITSWVGLHAGTLDPDQQALLDRELPQWTSDAARLIAEGLLGYVTVELVEPDLAHDKTVDPAESVTAEEFAGRLSAHLIDFVDYRHDLPRAARLKRH